MALKPLQEEYISWLLTSRRDRQVHGWPQTDKEWAAWKGIADRTLRRWKDQDEFATVYEQRRVELARQLMPGGTVSAEQIGGARAPADPRYKTAEPARPATERDDPVWDDELDPDEQDYRVIKDTVVRLAKDGDPRASELYFRTYGRAFVEAEQQVDSLVANMTDDALADELIATLGPARVRAALERAA